MVTRLQSSDVYDVRGIVEFFGGRVAICSDLERFGIVKIKPYAVDKWVERGAIPLARLEDLKTLARTGRRLFPLAKFKTKQPKQKKAA